MVPSESSRSLVAAAVVTSSSAPRGGAVNTCSAVAPQLASRLVSTLEGAGAALAEGTAYLQVEIMPSLLCKSEMEPVSSLCFRMPNLCRRYAAARVPGLPRAVAVPHVLRAPALPHLARASRRPRALSLGRALHLNTTSSTSSSSDWLEDLSANEKAE
jgi:hypothetical protein